MRALDHDVAVPVDQAAPGLCLLAPKQKDDRMMLRRNRIHDGARELLPTMAGMAVALPCANSEDGVQKQNAVLGPWLERSARRHLVTAILAELGKDVSQRRRPRAIGRREGKPMSLTRSWVRILAQDDCPDAFERGSTKGLEHLLVRRVDLACLAFGRDEALDRLQVVCQQPIAEGLAPVGRN